MLVIFGVPIPIVGYRLLAYLVGGSVFNGTVYLKPFTGFETDPRRDPVGNTVELSSGNMRVDERMLEERPEGEVEVLRRAPAFEERQQSHRNGQSVAEAARAAGHCRPSEHQENAVRRAVGRRQLPAARRPGRAGRISEHATIGYVVNRSRHYLFPVVVVDR